MAAAEKPSTVRMLPDSGIRRTEGPMNKSLMLPLLLSVAVTVAASLIVRPLVTGAEKNAAVSSRTASSRTAEMKSRGPADLKMIDLSHHDSVTDWNALRSSVDGIFIKATEGVGYVDPLFGSYAAAAIAAGIPVGFYHYFQPTDVPTNACQQADEFYASIRSYGYRMRPVLDIEESNGLTSTEIIEDVKAFADEFHRLSGQTVMIYCSPKYADTYLDDPSLSAYPLWIAHYNVSAPRSTSTWQNYSVWQYNDSVTVAGVGNPVDGDVATSDVFLPAASSPSGGRAQTLAVK